MTLNFSNEASKQLLLLIGHDTDHDFFQNLDPFTKEVIGTGAEASLGGGGKVKIDRERDRYSPLSRPVTQKPPPSPFTPSSGQPGSASYPLRRTQTRPGEVSREQSGPLRSGAEKLMLSSGIRQYVKEAKLDDYEEMDLEEFQYVKGTKLDDYEEMDLEEFYSSFNDDQTNIFTYFEKDESNKKYNELNKLSKYDISSVDEKIKRTFREYKAPNTTPPRTPPPSLSDDEVMEDFDSSEISRIEKQLSVTPEMERILGSDWSELRDLDLENGPSTSDIQQSGGLPTRRMERIKQKYNIAMRDIECIKNIFSDINTWNYQIYKLEEQEVILINNINNNIKNDESINKYAFLPFFEWLTKNKSSIDDNSILVGIINNLITPTPEEASSTIQNKLDNYQRNFFITYTIFNKSIDELIQKIQKFSDEKPFPFKRELNDGVDDEIVEMWNINIDEIVEMWNINIDEIRPILNSIFIVLKKFIKYTSDITLKIEDNLELTIDLDIFIKKKWNLLYKKVDFQNKNSVLYREIDNFFKEIRKEKNEKLTLSPSDNTNINHLRFFLMTYWAELSGCNSAPTPLAPPPPSWAKHQYERMSTEEKTTIAPDGACKLKHTISDDKLKKDFFNEYSNGTNSNGTNLNKMGFFKSTDKDLSNTEDLVTNDDIRKIKIISDQAYENKNCGNNASAVKLYIDGAKDKDNRRKITQHIINKAKNGTHFALFSDENNSNSIFNYNCTLPGVGDPAPTCSACRLERKRGLSPPPSPTNSCDTPFSTTLVLNNIGSISFEMEKGPSNNLSQGRISYGITLDTGTTFGQTTDMYKRSAGNNFNGPTIGKLYNSDKNERLLSKTSVIGLVMEYITLWMNYSWATLILGSSTIPPSSKSEILGVFVKYYCEEVYSKGTGRNHGDLNTTPIKDIASLFTLKAFGDMGQEIYGVYNYIIHNKPTVYFGNDWISYIRFLFMLYNVEQDWSGVPFWSGFLGNTSFHVIYYINGVSGGKVNKKKKRKSAKRKKSKKLTKKKILKKSKKINKKKKLSKKKSKSVSKKK